ncbi:glucosamine--fructose-6-phosphate aminotransferase [Candidatus Vondammii sp. HM_W22]|uniref:glucosamine--fructose-6-phosphate aminotransferase n=1 Tax=Candidatus Vondammii sp. HM_W22 TaxID=2687299 RepID=UPI001F129D2C|nr:glucosamine--fructose-6-phosphate aminotransferase [Candidatus Vondammii sp. HM_W22]
MPKFITSLTNWGSDSFSRVLKSEIENLETSVLPLHKGTTQGGLVDDSNISATIINFAEEEGYIRAKVGIFFNEIIGGCSCGDDPLSENAYCEIQVSIDKVTAEANFLVESEAS